jgi:phage-related protein
MSSIVSSLSDLVKSMVEVVWSLFTTAGQLVEKTIQFVLHLFTSAINLVVEFGKGLVDLFGGIVSFLLGKLPHITSSRRESNLNIGNLAILAVLGLAFFGFLQYQRRQGNTVQVGNKKLN